MRATDEATAKSPGVKLSLILGIRDARDFATLATMHGGKSMRFGIP